MKLTKANGYIRTTYLFLDQFSGNRRIYEKEGRYYIMSNGRIVDVTDMRCSFYLDF